ncbi:hypothetical protein BDZ91DRAFT_788927 [Kalaharituber pfeilii]|nr:hypothetical protein BDZ91DRAFT_788927 [Kalaharituber pfeilii]
MASLLPSIKPKDYADGNGIPVFSIVKGMTFALVCRKIVAALARFASCSRRIKTPQGAPWDEGFVKGLYGEDVENEEVVEARTHQFEITQGAEMGRRSMIGTQVVVNEGTRREKVVARVQLRGTAVKVMEGLVEY